MYYRIYQFISAFFSKITADEKLFVNVMLSLKEQQVFNKLQKSDAKHSIKMALYLAKLHPTDDILKKAALLHDIGKTIRPLNVIEKSLTVVLDTFFQNFAHKLSLKQNSLMDVYYNHPQKGVLIAHQLDLEDIIIFLIKNHHNHSIKDARLQALISADNLY